MTVTLGLYYRKKKEAEKLVHLVLRPVKMIALRQDQVPVFYPVLIPHLYDPQVLHLMMLIT